MTPPVRLWHIFLAFLEIAMSSIGGSMQVWVHRGLVVRRSWLTEEEFIELLGLCRMIPGPTMVNIAIYVGTRLRGVGGAIAGFLGILLVPVLCAVALLTLALEYSNLPAVQSAFRGMGAASAGLSVAMGLQFAEYHSRRPWAIAVTLLIFAGIAIAGLPMAWVVLFAVGVSMAFAAQQVKREPR